ncbi:hypothetical protein EVAR_78113_1 [Eumeta japonica]|uniref:Uncharacterized protein n=1 Tax=Eumeta variegata TaxID=151549 RepID=A0A4C1T0H0_EUMVA|nr:hypothetical protein EVAR_78113_1 [Eumeta japonica]
MADPKKRPLFLEYAEISFALQSKDIGIDTQEEAESANETHNRTNKSPERGGPAIDSISDEATTRPLRDRVLAWLTAAREDVEAAICDNDSQMILRGKMNHIHMVAYIATCGLVLHGEHRAYEKTKISNPLI